MKRVLRMMFILLFCSLFRQGFAANIASVLKTSREVTQGSALFLGRYDPAAKLRLELGLTPPKLAEEELFLEELQDKQSANYHHFLSPAEWNARFAPAEKDEQAVVDWAESKDLTITKRYANRLLVNVEGTVENIEKAFAVQINRYQLGENIVFSNDRDPVIPANLVGTLDYVGGLNSIHSFHAPHESSTVQSSVDYTAGPVSVLGPALHADAKPGAYAQAMKAGPWLTDGNINPTGIYDSYGYDFAALQSLGHCCNPTNNSGGATRTTSIAIAINGDFADSDIEGFQKQYPYLAYNIQRVYINGTPACCDEEATLDTEWATATANSFGSYEDTAKVWVYEKSFGPNYFATLVNSIADDDRARVLSISLGCEEFNCSWSLATIHATFNSMVGEGWTIVAASGDGGAAAGCQAHDSVSYPAADPDVVAVGGTRLSLQSNGVFKSETAWQGAIFTGACAKNDGGSGGGCSVQFAAPLYQNNPLHSEYPDCGVGSRSVPDIALNASASQNIFFQGTLQGIGGTSIAAPQVAGFMAQENAYLLSLGDICGLGTGTSPCAPIGQANYPIYLAGSNRTNYAPHYPFYSITSGCNSNDVTKADNLNYYCAHASGGHNEISGWGSFNALQMAWMMNYSTVAASGPAYVTFTGPGTGKWYNTDRIISWSVFDTTGAFPVSGSAGYSQAWDIDPGDNSSEPNQSRAPNPAGTGNFFFTGPQHPNGTFGCTDLSGSLCTGGPVKQGFHTLHVRAWDNIGASRGDQTYGPIGYDTIQPVTKDALSGALSGSTYIGPVKVTLSASDPGFPTTGSGVTRTVYQVNGGSITTYKAPFTVSAPGSYKITFHSADLAGNVESTKSVSFTISSSAR